MLLHYRLVERWYCLREKGCPHFNCKEDAPEPWIVLLLEIPCSLETDVPFSVNRHEGSTYVTRLNVRHFDILKSQILVLFLLILKLYEIIRMRNDKKYKVLIFVVYIEFLC